MKTQRTHKAPGLDTRPADRNRRGCHWTGTRGDILPWACGYDYNPHNLCLLLIFGIEQVGLGGRRLLFVGGVANKVLNLAKCPVLIVR